MPGNHLSRTNDLFKRDVDGLNFVDGMDFVGVFFVPVFFVDVFRGRGVYFPNRFSRMYLFLEVK